jgi:hypothetical protein
LAFAAVVAALVLIPIPIVRAYHDSSVRALTDRLLSAPRVDVPTEPSAGGRDLRVIEGAVLADAADPTQTAYLDVEVDLAACPDGVTLGLQYDPSDPFHDYSIAIQPQPRGIIVERFMTPVFRGFRGLALNGAPLSCVRRVTRLASVRGLPLLPTLTLPAAWRDMPGHQRIGAQALRLWNFGR